MADVPSMSQMVAVLLLMMPRIFEMGSYRITNVKSRKGGTDTF